MLAKVAIWFAGIVAVFVAFLFIAGPQMTDRLLNRTGNAASHAKVQPKDDDKLEDIFYADLHADSLLWGRDLLKRNDHGHVDVPRLIEGGVAIQAFTVVSKTPLGLNIESNDANTADMITLLAVVQRWPRATWSSLFERAIYQSQRLKAFEVASAGRLEIIKDGTQLGKFMSRYGNDPRRVAAILGIEGLQVLEGKLENVDALFNAGFRMMAPTHFFDTEVGGSASGLKKGGLTDFGRLVIRRMEALGIVLDLAHTSAALIDEATKMATRPVVVSHTGVKGTCDNNRNLGDDQLRAIAATGGVIGIGYWETAVCGQDAQSIANAIEYTAKLVGADHVALGSDFDGAVKAPFDTTQLRQIADALLADGMSPTDVRKVMGGNVVRVFTEVLLAP